MLRIKPDADKPNPTMGQYLILPKPAVHVYFSPRTSSTLAATLFSPDELLFPQTSLLSHENNTAAVKAGERHLGPVSQKSRNFSSLFWVTQFPLYHHNAEVLNHQTLQFSWLSLH